MDSILQTKRECLVCNTTYDLHKHHVFYGIANRKLSDKHGCWCWLCANHHNMSDQGIHFDKTLDKTVKAQCQRMWMGDDRTVEEFIKIFGRSFI